MDLIFTDLDGTLLDHSTYDWAAASPALRYLQQSGIPWVPVTSKTRAELEFWRRRLCNPHPFIVENGGAAYFPRGYFSSQIPGSIALECYDVLEWGARYEDLIHDLHAAATSARCRVRGFGEMTTEEVATVCDLPLHQAALARQREYDEPFVILDPDRADTLASAIEELGRTVTRGGRFWHILGANDKARAVRTVAELFEHERGAVRTIGLGDGLNDASFLNVVDIPIIVRSAQSAELQQFLPNAFLTGLPGPAGWNDAILSLTCGS